MKFKLTSECYFLPFEMEEHKRDILYFPLKSLLLKVNKPARKITEKLRDSFYEPQNLAEEKYINHLVKLSLVNGPPEQKPFQRHPVSPEPIRTIFITSDRCNLRCRYCYNSSSGTGNLMPLDTGKITVDYIVQNALRLNSGEIEIGFHGGGEPTVNWTVLTGVTEYAEELCRRHNLQLKSTICTNGILTSQQVEWLAKHIEIVVISFDGPPEIQNFQRPGIGNRASFRPVARAIDQFGRLKKPYIFRVTVTSLAEDKIPEIIEYFNTRFKPKTICMEPMYLCGRCSTSELNPPGEDLFIEGHTRGTAVAQQHKVPLQYSGARSFYLDSIFCGVAGRNFFITPDGDVTSCIEVTGPEDPRSEIFFYGRLNQDKMKFEFNLDRYYKLCSLQVQHYEPCQDCFAKWHCSGDCPAKFPDISEKKHTIINEYRCKLNRTLTQQQLLRSWDGEFEPARGKSSLPCIVAVKDLLPLNKSNRLNYLGYDQYINNQEYLNSFFGIKDNSNSIENGKCSVD